MQAKEKPAIKIWRFEDAPKELRDQCDDGGDEDWLALIPKPLACAYIGFLDEGTAFGCCCVEVHKLKNGDEIRVGKHA